MRDVAMLAAVVIGLAILADALAPGRSPRRRPARSFYRGRLRREVFDRAGWRCEHHSLLWGRCQRRARHADHIRPYSRGGRTTLDNGQALCAFHNLRWGASYKGMSYNWRLRRRRMRY